MPNWVFNKVYFSGNKEKIKELKDFVTTSESCFDFNKLIPMPEELKMESGSMETVAIDCAKARNNGKKTCATYENYKTSWKEKETFDELADLGDKYLSNLEKYGSTTWYDWCWKNWGTKWNSCEPSWQGDDYVDFNTAWSAPLSIYEQMTKLFPEVLFDVSYADEDMGNNCGTVSWDGHELSWVPMDDYEFACDVWGWDPQEQEEEEVIV